MPFPKQQGAKAPKGAGGESASCYFCKQQVDREDPQGYIQGTCSKCGARPYCVQCVADYVEKNVRTLNSNSKAMEKGRNIARNRPQDLFAQNRTVQRKPQNCPDSACSGLMIDAELVKPQKPQQQQEAEDENTGVPTPAKQLPVKAQAVKPPPKAPATAPVIKRLVSAPTTTRITSGGSGAEGGEETSRSGSATPAALSRAASTSTEGASRPASSLGARPAAAAAAAAAARRQLEQQREAAAALKSDNAAAGRRSSAVAASSGSSSMGNAAGSWGKVPRSVSAPVNAEKKGPAEEWPALGPGGNQPAVAQQPAHAQPSAASYASLLDLPPRPDSAASRLANSQSAVVEAAVESSAGRAALPPAMPNIPAAALPGFPSVDSETSSAVHDTFSDSDDDSGADFAGGIAAALRKQQQALLQQLASGQQPWEQAQQAAQPAAQQQGPVQPPMLEQAQQPSGALEQQPATQPWYEQAPAVQPGLLALPPHLSSQQQAWEQQAAAQPAYGWQQQEPSLLWQHSEQPAGYDDGYAAGLAAAAAMMQQQQGMGGQAQPDEQAAPPAQAYVPPPQVRPEGDEAEVDELLSLLGIG